MSTRALLFSPFLLLFLGVFVLPAWQDAHRGREVPPTVLHRDQAVSPTVLHRDREVSPTGRHVFVLSAWQDASPFRSRARFEEAVRYLEQEQYDEALAAFQAILKQTPAQSLTYCYIGIVYEEKNMLSEAIAAYQAALAVAAPPHVHGNAHLHSGIVYKAQGQLPLAEKHLKQAVMLLPETAEVRIHLGDVHLLQHRLKAAERAYRAGMRLNPERPESYYGLGRVAEMQNNLTEAVAHYRDALARNQYLAQAYYRLALTYRLLREPERAKTAMSEFTRMKVYEDAVHYYRESLYTHPNKPTLYIKLGALHESVDNLAAAERIYHIATTVHPKFLPPYHRLGELFIRQRDLEKANAVYTRVTEIVPDDAKAWLKLGVIAINQKRFPNAIQAFQSAIAADSMSAEAHNNLARVYAGLGEELQEAVALAKQAVALAPTAKHYDTLAYAYYRNGRYAEALVAIQRALAMEPEREAYQKLLSEIQAAQDAAK